MQTFLPFESFDDSAACLDMRRLGKQRVEGYQLLLQLCGVRMVDFPVWVPRLGGWNHPAMAMWAGHEIQLVEYISAMCREWTKRGYKDSCLEKSVFVLNIVKQNDWLTEKPDWVFDDKVRKTHRSNLLLKDFDFYKTIFPEDVPQSNEKYLDYIWPKTTFNMNDRKTDNFLFTEKLYNRLYNC